MKRTLMTLLTAIGAAASLVLAACGGGGDNVVEPQPKPPVDCNKTPEQCK